MSSNFKLNKVLKHLLFHYIYPSSIKLAKISDLSFLFWTSRSTDKYFNKPVSVLGRCCGGDGGAFLSQQSVPLLTCQENKTYDSIRCRAC